MTQFLDDKITSAWGRLTAEERIAVASSWRLLNSMAHRGPQDEHDVEARRDGQICLALAEASAPLGFSDIRARIGDCFDSDVRRSLMRLRMQSLVARAGAGSLTRYALAELTAPLQT